MGNLPVVSTENPVELMRRATDVAGACKQIVINAVCSIQGRRYIKVEGWQAIAIAHNCILSARDTKKVEGGYTSIGEVRRISDGVVIATAEGFLGDDEKTWKNRDEFAKRAMVQTRAMSRVGRSAFAHVVVMMNAGLETTPAEEIPSEERVHPTEQRPQEDRGSFRDVILECTYEQKPGRKNKNIIYTIYTIETGENGEFKSLSEAVGEIAFQVKGTGEVVLIHSRPGKYGPEIEEIERPTPPPPTEEPPSPVPPGEGEE